MPMGLSTHPRPEANERKHVPEEQWRREDDGIEQLPGVHEAMMGWGVMLGKVVSQIVGATAPMDKELLLLDVIADPIKAHVNGLGTPLPDGVINDTGGTGIVCLNGCGRLGVAKILKGGVEPSCILGIIEQGAHFGLRCRGQDHTHIGTCCMDGSIDWGWFPGWQRCNKGIMGSSTQEEISASLAMGMCL